MNELMTVEGLIQNIACQLNRHNSSKLTPETVLVDIEGWSSLEALFVMLMVDEVYKVNLSGDDITYSTTIKDLYNIIKSRT
jgi:acyl carrier protein